MVIAYMVLGVLAGVVGFAIALGFGASIWSAVLTYVLVGAGTVGLSGLVLPALGRGRAPREQEDFIEPEVELRSSLPSAAETLDDADWTTMHILAVDDDPFILELIPKIAATAGFLRVTTASSAAVALDLIAAAARPFDCLLLDINMPVVNGIDLCERVRRLAAYGETPIIMLTAMTDIDHMNRAFRAGASDYTTKPFDIVDFADRLQIASARVAAERSRIEQPIRITADERLTPVKEVPALVNPRALASYVSRLTGSALTGAYVMAVALDADTDDLPVTYLPTLVRTAMAIDGIFGPTRHLVSHMGGGRFVMVASGSVMPDPDAVRDDLGHRLNDSAERHDDHHLVVSVGRPIRLQMAKVDRSRIAFESAIALATKRHVDALRRYPAEDSR